MSNRTDLDDDLPEMELAGGVRGKYYERYKQGTNVVLLDPDMAKAFRDSAAVNETLRKHVAERWAHEKSEPAEASGRTVVAHPWRLDASSVFWDTLALLEDSPAVASVLLSCLERLREAPWSSAQISDTAVRVANTKEEWVEGRRVPPLRIIYALREQDDAIELLFVQPAENAAAVPQNIASEIQDFLRRAG